MRWTEIILGVLTLLGGCAWFVNFRKDKQEAGGIRADNRQKEMDLSKMYVDEEGGAEWDTLKEVLGRAEHWTKERPLYNSGEIAKGGIRVATVSQHTGKGPEENHRERWLSRRQNRRGQDRGRYGIATNKTRR